MVSPEIVSNMKDGLSGGGKRGAGGGHLKRENRYVFRGTGILLSVSVGAFWTFVLSMRACVRAWILVVMVVCDACVFCT